MPFEAYFKVRWYHWQSQKRRRIKTFLVSMAQINANIHGTHASYAPEEDALKSMKNTYMVNTVKRHLSG